MNRRRALILLAGSGVLAGCAPGASPLLHLPSGAPGRGADAFPRRRPDGSLPPRTAAGYRPAGQITAGPATRSPQIIQHICTGDTCPGDGGGDPGGGPQPDRMLAAGGVLGYYFSSQNYVETWNADGSELLNQWYWSVDGALSNYGAQLWRVRHDVATGGGPTKPCDTCTVRQQNVNITVSVGGGTFTATHDNGWSISGHANGAGNVALTVSVGGDISTATIAYQPPSPSCSALSLKAAAAIAPIVLNVVATSSGCSVSPDTCTAGGVLVGAMSAGTIDAVSQWETAEC
jgi:hypothetical protein